MPNNQLFTDWVPGDTITADKLNQMKNNLQPYLDRGAINYAIDWNTITTAGSYAIAPQAFSGSNYPPATYTWGTLLVLNINVDGITQVYFPHVNDTFIYTRQKWTGATMSPWVRVGSFAGSNSNGTYVRFADGTQICYASHADSSYGGTIVSTEDSNYRYRSKTWVFPASFSTAPVVVHTGDVVGARVDIFIAWSVTTTQVTLEAGQYNTSSVTVNASYSIAIGRWY